MEKILLGTLGFMNYPGRAWEGGISQHENEVPRMHPKPSPGVSTANSKCFPVVLL